MLLEHSFSEHRLAFRLLLQSYQATTYTCCLGVSRSTCTLASYIECGRYPIRVHWLYRTVNYWNTLVNQEAESDILNQIPQANIYASCAPDLSP